MRHPIFMVPVYREPMTVRRFMGEYVKGVRVPVAAARRLLKLR